MSVRASSVRGRWQAHPTWPVEGSAEWWADLQAQIVDEYLPGERDRERAVPLVATALLVGVVFATFLFVLPFVGLVLGAVVGVPMP